MKKNIKLGKQTAKYCQQPLNWRFFFLLFLPASALVTAIFAFAYWVQVQTTVQFGPIFAEIRSRPWFILGGISLILLILWLVQRIKRAHRCLIIYKNGIIIQRPYRRKITLPWSQIKGVSTLIIDRTFLKNKIISEYYLTIHSKNGKKFRLPSNENHFPEMVSRIKARLYPLLHDQYQRSIHADQDIDFGSIKISKYNLTTGNTTIPWKDIRMINIKTGMLLIELYQSKSIRIPIKKIINPDLMMQIIQDEVIA